VIVAAQSITVWGSLIQNVINECTAASLHTFPFSLNL